MVDVARVTQAVFAPAFLLIGLSHALQPERWVAFFRVVKGTGVAGFIVAMFTLPVSLPLLVLHNKWVWDWSLFLTVAGWGMTIKSSLYALWPQFADRMLEKKMAQSPAGFRVAGIAMTALAAVLVWQVRDLYVPQ